MAEYSAVHITIGGAIPAELVPQLCEVISQERLALENEGSLFEPSSAEELLAARQLVAGQLVLQLSDDEVSYGEFPELEAFLVLYKIPFDRRTEASYSYPPYCVFYRPASGAQDWRSTNDGSLLVEAGPLWDLIDALHREGSTLRAPDLVQRLQQVLPARPSPLPALEIGQPAASVAGL